MAQCAACRSGVPLLSAIGLALACVLIGCSSSNVNHATGTAGESTISASSEPTGAAAPSSPGSASADALGTLPDDLTIDLTVLPGAGLEKRVDAHLTRSKYILFPDGTLHGDRGRSLGFLTRPARQRTLSREAMADLWLVLRQSGFEPVSSDSAASSSTPAEAQTASPSGPPDSVATYSGNPALLAPSPGEVLTILSVRAAGAQATYLNRCAPDDATPAWLRVTRAIARLAWATDDPPVETVVQPIRYDFGPDPYQRYRTHPGTPRGASAGGSAPSK